MAGILEGLAPLAPPESRPAHGSAPRLGTLLRGGTVFTDHLGTVFPDHLQPGEQAASAPWLDLEWRQEDVGSGTPALAAQPALRAQGRPVGPRGLPTRPRPPRRAASVNGHSKPYQGGHLISYHPEASGRFGRFGVADPKKRRTRRPQDGRKRSRTTWRSSGSSGPIGTSGAPASCQLCPPLAAGPSSAAGDNGACSATLSLSRSR